MNIDTFFDFALTHTHYAKVRSGGQVEEFLLTKSRRSHNFTSPGAVIKSTQTGWQAFSQYVEIGAKHILSGVDHLALAVGLSIQY